MDNKQVFMFFADVVALAARHFGGSPHTAPAEPRPAESAGAPAEAVTPPAGVSRAEVWDHDLMSTFSGELSRVLEEDDDRDDEIAELQRRSRSATTTRVGSAGDLDRFVAVDDLVSKLAGLGQETIPERVGQDRLHAELADLRRAVETTHEYLAQTIVEVRRVAEQVRQDRATVRAEDVLRSLLTFARSAPATPSSNRGRDIEVELKIDFFQMVRGDTVPLRIETDGAARTLDVAVPAGIADGTTLTLPAQGDPGEPPGDLLIRIRVIPDVTFTRDGNDIAMRVPVPPQALARKKLSVEAPTGALAVSISAEHLGRTLRCKGKGIAPEGQEPGDLLIMLDPSPILAATIDQFPSPAAAFEALRSLCPAARAHLTHLTNWAERSSLRQDIRDVLWALAVAHEGGLRAPLRGFAAEIVSELVERGSLRPANSWRSRRSHVFAWLGDKSPLVTREPPSRSPALVWTVHLDRLGDESHWSRVGAPTLVTH